MGTTLTAPVGKKGQNLAPDVAKVRDLLNKVPGPWGGPFSPLPAKPSPTELGDALEAFSGRQFEHAGRVDTVKPGDDVLGRLDAAATTTETPLPAGPNGEPAVQYTIPTSQVLRVKQRDTMTCWAATARSLVGWKNGQCVPEENIFKMTKDEAYYLDLFKKNQVIPFANTSAFAGDRLRILAAENTVPFWLAKLKAVGPMGVSFNMAASQWHLMILFEMTGDGTSYGTTCNLMDPGIGLTRSLVFQSFAEKYAKVIPITVTLPIWHWSMGTKPVVYK